MSSNEDRLKRLAQRAQEQAQARADEAERQYQDAQARRASQAQELARRDIDAWIQIIEQSIDGHPDGCQFNWGFHQGWFRFGPRWDRNQGAVPAIDFSRFFRRRDIWSVEVLVDLGTYFEAVNKKLAGKFVVGCHIYESGSGGYFYWRRI